MLSFTNKRVLITGSNGFIGNHLTNRLLKEKAIVYTVAKTMNYRNNVHSYCVDIRNYKILKKILNMIQPDFIFHLAALTSKRLPKQDYLDVNYNGTINLLSSLKDVPFKRFIFFSTAEVYHGNPAPFSEELCTLLPRAALRPKCPFLKEFRPSIPTP